MTQSNDSVHSLHIWLRDETKPHERRTALTPRLAKELIKAGVKVSIESSEVRCFPDQEYVNIGCKMVAPGSWRKAPQDAVILGLKELPEENSPLIHRHIFFAHAYKGQKGWESVIRRFKEGGGLLWDMEFLVDDSGRRVAAFGRWAGYAGAALAVDIWSHQMNHAGKKYPAVKLVNHKEELLTGLRARLETAMQKAGRSPRALIMGAKGRCGTGAHELFRDLNFKADQLVLWDKEETQKGGPFSEILQQDIFVNCVLLMGQMPPFFTPEMIDQARKLSVISDVSCDPNSPHNPLPIYEQTTTFSDPVIRLRDNPQLDLTAIDHLPSLLPRESSEDYGEQLFPHLMALTCGSSVWGRAEALYRSFEAKV